MRLKVFLAIMLVLVVLPNIAHTEPNLDSVAERHYDQAFLERSEAYHAPRISSFILRSVIQLVVLWGFALLLAPKLFSHGSHRIPNWVRRWIGLTVAWGLSLLIRIPFTAHAFSRAREFGLRHDSWGSFAMDWAQGAAIQWVLVSVVGLCLLGFLGQGRRFGWAMAGTLISVLACAYAYVAPIVIDPLFNQIRPLEESELRTEVVHLVQQSGLELEGVWVADASRRTRAVNAYFTGFGSSRRVVLYDTLIDTLPKDEALLVVAHELGHWQKQHVNKGLLMGLVATFAGLALAQFLMNRVARRQGSSPLKNLTSPAWAPVAYAVYVSVFLLSLPVSNSISRAMETEADQVALKLIQTPDVFIDAKVRMAKQNLSNVNPPRWVEVIFFTHPSNVRRIALAEAGL
ncbi:MAG: M48 family metallopeptidase [Candidatus Eisenbacteria bacterium]|uniref:M48 family metallopeptidase n=1 Tax=Eiseniibacteriota bacterium TaxID=2212470 RepID=A0A7Y2E9E1_UNCEI|nr:M48 family metallopeptidase [Candidatus Eisenbacteria bacterium]